MFGSFFNTVEVDQYADWIVAELRQALPPDSELGAKRVTERAKVMNDRIAKRTIELTRKVRLNVYKKAHLAARVREGMSANGYPQDFVRSFSFDLLTRIQAAVKQT